MQRLRCSRNGTLADSSGSGARRRRHRRSSRRGRLPGLVATAVRAAHGRRDRGAELVAAPAPVGRAVERTSGLAHSGQLGIAPLLSRFWGAGRGPAHCARLIGAWVALRTSARRRYVRQGQLHARAPAGALRAARARLGAALGALGPAVSVGDPESHAPSARTPDTANGFAAMPKSPAICGQHWRLRSLGGLRCAASRRGRFEILRRMQIGARTQPL
jgi:hypothetical protein